MNRTAKLIARKVRPQFGNPRDQRLSSDQKFMFAIVEQALKDAFCSSSYVQAADRDSAKRYLAGDMPHARACGVNPDWIRRVIGRIDA